MATATREGKKNPRIEKLKQGVRPKVYELSIEKCRLITEIYQQTEGEPLILRRAKAHAHMLDKINIFIRDGELLVGATASKFMGVEIDFIFGCWAEEAIEELVNEGWGVTPEQKEELKSLRAYWKGKSMMEEVGRLYDDELWSFLQIGVTIPPQKDRTVGVGGFASSGMNIHLGGGITQFDYGKILNGGLNAIIREAEEELSKTRPMTEDSMKKREFLEAVIISYKGVISWANRYSILAAELAAKEKDPARKKEHERIAATCKQVPAEPARDFYEAMQSLWFTFLVLAGSTTSFARFDQYMYPFFKKDIESGKITDEDALELLQCLRLKDMEINSVRGYKGAREKWSGMAKWNNMLIGGQTPEGKDATNALSYLVLEAAFRCRTPHHTVTVRVWDGTPEALLMKGLELVRTGMGMPAFISDRSYIEMLLSNGMPLNVARDFAVGGCLDVAVMGRSRAMALSPFNLPKTLELFLNNGVQPETGRQVGPRTDPESYKSFDELMEAWKKHCYHYQRAFAQVLNILIKATHDKVPDPFQSALFVDALKLGRHMWDRKMPYENECGMMAIGVINVADSLAAIKRLVYDDKTVTMKKLKEALAANWEGEEYSQIRKMCLAAPKFGNNTDYVDSIAADIFRYWAESVPTFESYHGGKIQPSAVSLVSHWPGGMSTGATPDGRYAGEILADGTVSPVQGRDTNGPTAVMLSAAKIDQTPFQSTLLNIKFHPSTLQTAEDLRKLASMIRTYFGLGGRHVQFNVIDRDTLIDAQKKPDEYRDLLIRVAGYSTYFTLLNKPVQDEIIARTENHAIS